LKKLPKIKTLRNKLWKLVSEYVRRSGGDRAACYTCGIVKNWKEIDAGHAISGRSNMVLFDLSIIRPQCKYCNGPKGGMYYEFGTKLNQENGDGWYEKKKRESKGIKKLDRAFYNDMIDEMKIKLEAL
jgi:hypothetical protein